MLEKHLQFKRLSIHLATLCVYRLCAQIRSVADASPSLRAPADGSVDSTPPSLAFPQCPPTDEPQAPRIAHHRVAGQPPCRSDRRLRGGEHHALVALAVMSRPGDDHQARRHAAVGQQRERANDLRPRLGRVEAVEGKHNL